MLTALKLNYRTQTQKFNATVGLMAALVRRYRWNPQIRETALNVIRRAGVQERDVAGEIRALYDFVNNSIKFRGDVRDVETLQTPDITLRVGAGDCDDKSVILNTLLESVGRKTRFQTISQNNRRKFTHVLSQVYFNGQWISLETTRRVPMGDGPTLYTRSAYYEY